MNEAEKVGHTLTPLEKELVAALKAMCEQFIYHNPGGITKPQSAALGQANKALAQAKSTAEKAEGQQ